MRKINKIIIHCSATREDEEYPIVNLRVDHIARGFRDVGYHFYIRKNGFIHDGRSLGTVGAHVRGHNSDSLGVCYEGGLDKNGNPSDTRTEDQKGSILMVIRQTLEYLKIFQDVSDIEIVGHRDLSPDLNYDGVIDSTEWMKECPCFDAKKEYAWIMA